MSSTGDRPPPRTRRRLLGLLMAAGLAACGGPASPAPASPTPNASPSPAASAAAGRPILVDTDVAPDDVMALAYLAARTDIDLVAVTISGTGEARCPDGVRVVRGVLERLGRTGIPVSCGPDRPLVGEHAFPSPWRDFVAAGFGLDLPEPTGPGVDLDAPSLIAQAARDAAGGLEVLTLGPLTNLAVAFQGDPSLAARLAGVTIMGGAALTAGNVGDPDGDGESVNAEWNAYIDPRALAIVLGSGADATLVPLDATDDVPMSASIVDRIAANQVTEPARLVYEYLSRNPERIGGTSLWDQTAAILLVEGPEGFTLERLPLAVIEDEGRESGRTKVAADGEDTLVATAADAADVTRRFIEGLNGGRAEAPIPPPTATIAMTFDGTICRVDAPDRVTAGFGELMLVNDSETDAGAAVVAFSDPATWESLLDVIASGPITGPPMGVTVVLSTDAASGGRGEDLALLAPGAYGSVCVTFGEAGLMAYPGRPLAVDP